MRIFRRQRAAAVLVLVATLGHGLVSLVVGPNATASGHPQGAWTATSSLGTGRGSGTATMLDGPACRVTAPAAPAPWCGQVLAAGGRRSAKGALSSAELYDPVAGQWSFTGSMLAGRYGHTATLLDGPECQRPNPPEPPGHCGKVLVAGGAGGEKGLTALASAELYDPATGEWSSTGRMGPLGETGGVVQPRHRHAAGALDGPACRNLDLVPLPAPDWCGQVLVVGGQEIVRDTSKVDTFAVTALRTAAIYNPATGTWAAAAPPAVGRFDLTLTAIDSGPCRASSLPTPPPYCGRLLMAGGWVTEPVGAGVVASELYDPALGQWIPTGAMVTPRFEHKAVVLAGANCQASLFSQCNKVLVTGGKLQASYVNPIEASAELYDPLTGTWSPTGNKLYNPETGAELPTRGMAAARGSFHTLTLLDGPACRGTPPATPPAWCGKVLVVGDEVPENRPPELYDPVSGTFSPTRHRRTTIAGNAVLIDGAACRGTAQPPACGRVLNFGAKTAAVQVAELFDPSATSQPPAVSSLDPPSGPAQGGTDVILRGAGLTGATEVRFGDVAALTFMVESDNKLVATSPAMAPGEVDVTVAVGATTSAAINTTRFAVFPSNYEWAETGSLLFARPEPTVTPLLDGRALLVGGRLDPNVGSDSAEVFDPSTGQWDPVPPLATARNSHTATRLANGEVLVAGGAGPGCCPPLASAEVFDPATGLWRQTGRLIHARSAHSATLLPSGKVLVTGGSIGTTGEVRSTAELYDPDAINPATGERGVWSLAAPMRSFRRSHHAALLADGRVLVVGGRGCDSTPTPPLPGESQPSCGEPPPQGFPANDLDQVFDPTGNPTELRSAEVYDPMAGSGGAWSMTGGLIAPRGSHTTTALSTGGALVAGGCAYGNCGHPEPAELYDPAAGTWRTVNGMARARYLHTATVLSGPTCGEFCGQVLFVGGSGGSGKQSSAELYDPATGAWKPAPPLANAREAHGAALLTSGQVLVVGGNETGVPSLTGSAELFRVDAGSPVVAAVEPPAGPPGTRVVIRGADLSGTTSVNFGGTSVEPVAVTETVVVALSPEQRRGAVPVTVTTPLGTSTNNPLSDADNFTYAAGRWRGGPAMATARYLHTSTLLDGSECRRPEPPAYCGRILVAGGTANFAPDPELVPHASAEVYDPKAAAWLATGSMASPRFNHTATLLDGPPCRSATPPAHCGKVLVTGGLVGIAAINGAELYDPETRLWTSTTAMGTARMSHTATLLDDGRVLVVGGAADEPNRGGLNSAEIYDPASERWQGAAALSAGRNSHTATLLANGRVLVAGGLTKIDGANEFVETTEIYDPLARAWTGVEPMAVPRFAHTAVRLDGPRCGAACGKVLVVGGVKTLDDDSTTFHASAELFDPVTRTWSAAFAPSTGRAGHTATLLPNGQVLVAGSAMTFPQLPLATPIPSADLWDPFTGRWTPTDQLATRRGIAGAALLDGPACRRPAAPAYCGTVLIAGGATAGTLPESNFLPPPLSSSEIYTPAPDVHALAPPAGATDGGTSVVLAGTQLAGATGVRFGEREAASFVVDSPTSITAVSPAGGPGPVEVTVEGPGGSSAVIGGNPAASFAYLGPPGPVTALVARAVSSSAIELTFAAADNGDGSSSAQTYVVKQSSEEITEANFDAATSTALCRGTCHFAPPALTYTLLVDDLEPGRTYHYALRAVNDKGRGPLSINVSATTEALVKEVPPPCPAVPVADAGTAVYPGGRYSLVGLPDSAVVGSQSPLYGWSDLGAGGTYSIFNAAEPVGGGKGYWAWFSCPKAVTLPPGAGASTSASFPLGAYHASMVGNPSAAPATVRGHDFAATWDPYANDGGGAYRMSSYRQAQILSVGEGAWTFSYVRTEIHIEAAG